MLIRQALPTDAAALTALLTQLDRETEFMLFETGERQTTVQRQRERLETLQTSDQETILVAAVGTDLAGFVAGTGGGARRNRHSLYIVIGVVQAFTGQGVGKELMQALETWAQPRDFHRLELTVMAHNERAIRLYEACGFEREGVKRDSLLVNGDYVDELYMAKLS